MALSVSPRSFSLFSKTRRRSPPQHQRRRCHLAARRPSPTVIRAGLVGRSRRRSRIRQGRRREHRACTCPDRSTKSARCCATDRRAISLHGVIPLVAGDDRATGNWRGSASGSRGAARACNRSRRLATPDVYRAPLTSGSDIVPRTCGRGSWYRRRSHSGSAIILGRTIDHGFPI